jgi:hypothetical protein
MDLFVFTQKIPSGADEGILKLAQFYGADPVVQHVDPYPDSIREENDTWCGALSMQSAKHFLFIQMTNLILLQSSHAQLDVIFIYVI